LEAAGTLACATLANGPGGARAMATAMPSSDIVFLIVYVVTQLMEWDKLTEMACVTCMLPCVHLMPA